VRARSTVAWLTRTRGTWLIAVTVCLSMTAGAGALQGWRAAVMTFLGCATASAALLVARHRSTRNHGAPP
jgi:hypothetical protein